MTSLTTVDEARDYMPPTMARAGENGWTIRYTYGCIHMTRGTDYLTAAISYGGRKPRLIEASSRSRLFTTVRECVSFLKEEP